jgi:hypothetical protein
MSRTGFSYFHCEFYNITFLFQALTVQISYCRHIHSALKFTKRSNFVVPTPFLAPLFVGSIRGMEDLVVDGLPS